MIDLDTLHAIPVPATPAHARVKILYPNVTIGPSMHAEVLGDAGNRLQVRVPRPIVVGATVQVRSRERVAFGAVSASVPMGLEYQIDVDVERSS
jgi:hypothetical protein